jgi:hypothetical protein
MLVIEKAARINAGQFRRVWPMFVEANTLSVLVQQRSVKRRVRDEEVDDSIVFRMSVHSATSRLGAAEQRP